MRGRDKKRAREERLQNLARADAAEVMKDPVVIGLLMKIRNAPTDELRLQYANQLSRYNLGEDLEDVNPELNRKLKKLASDKDKAAEAWQKDRVGFISDIVDSAKKSLPTGDALERKKAEIAQKWQAGMRKGKAARSHKRLWLIDQIRNGPKDTIFVEGHLELHGADPKEVHVGEEISIFDQKFYIPPGKQTLPRVLADKIREKQQGAEELKKRQDALQSNLEWTELERTMKDIDTEFHTESFHLEG